MSSTGAPIQIYNRETHQEEVELVYGERAVDWLYGTAAGQTLEGFLSSRLPSQVYGAYQSSSLSRHKIPPFIKQFRIDMSEYVDPGFRSFNDFFIRQFRPGKRPFIAEAGRMAAPAEARYLAWDRVSADQTYPVKGQWLSARALLEDEALARPFEGGSVLLARLCPVDYHRFHFPDDGRVLETRRLPGKLRSVNPKALRFRGDIFATNERQVTLLETRNFGKLAYIEVGAICVGKIVQSHPSAIKGTGPFARGDEKGYFLFGGSTVIVLGEPGAWTPDADLLEQTRRHRECLVKLGTSVASAKRS